jgi:carbon-monoxide dehydrogenase small subunit
VIHFALSVNGKPVVAEIAPRTHLADFLREHLLLTGTHIGCEHGICGACTVEINGQIARSCITYAVTCDGAEIRTIESFDDDAVMARLRQAFTEEHALQCGYCTPGMLIAARDLVRRKTELSRAEIRIAMSGNLCRCTGYVGIVNAIERVMAEHVKKDFIPANAGNHVGSWLGPAPGPVASPATAHVSPVTSARATISPVHAPRSSSARSTRTPIRVTVGAIAEVDGATRLTQSFVLEHSRDMVWALMSDPQAVVRCMPGMSLDGPPHGDKVTGRLQVKIGPISASFAGEGTLKQIASEFRQIIEGRGGDRRSGSRVSGRVEYRLREIPADAGNAATGVDVAMSYVLTGPLAQIGRSAIVRDLARRIGEVFARNVDAQLREPGAPMSRTQLAGGRLLLQVIADRMRAFLASLLGRRT